MLKFLGSGGAFNVLRGNNCAYMILGTELMLFDCGEDVFKKLIKGKLFDRISRMNFFITHLHGDHAGGLSTTIAYLYIKIFNGDKSKIQIFFPSNNIVEMLTLQGIPNNWYTPYINAWDDLPVDGYDGKLEYEFKETNHIDTLNSFSISLNINGDTNIYYSGDTTDFDFDRDKADKYDYIYHEVTCILNSKVHLSYNKLVDLTKDYNKNQRQKIYLMHLDEDFCEDIAVKDGFNVVQNEVIT